MERTYRSGCGGICGIRCFGLGFSLVTGGLAGAIARLVIGLLTLLCAGLGTGLLARLCAGLLARLCAGLGIGLGTGLLSIGLGAGLVTAVVHRLGGSISGLAMAGLAAIAHVLLLDAVAVLPGIAETVIMLGMLKVVYSGNTVAGGRRVPGKGEIFLGHLTRGTPHLHVGTIAVKVMLFRCGVRLAAVTVARAPGVRDLSHSTGFCM